MNNQDLPAALPPLDAIADDPDLAASLSPAVRSRVLIRCAAVMVNISAVGIEERAIEQQVNSDEWLTLSELAERTGYGNSTIRGWVAAGLLKPGKHYTGVGKNRRFFLSAIKAQLDDDAIKPRQQEGAPMKRFVRKGRRHGGNSKAA